MDQKLEKYKKKCVNFFVKLNAIERPMKQLSTTNGVVNAVISQKKKSKKIHQVLLKFKAS